MLKFAYVTRVQVCNLCRRCMGTDEENVLRSAYLEHLRRRMWRRVIPRPFEVSAACSFFFQRRVDRNCRSTSHTRKPSLEITPATSATVSSCDLHLQTWLKTDVTPAILSRDFVAQLYHMTKSQVWHAVSHTATLSHKQELTNQRSPPFRDKVAQNRSLI